MADILKICAAALAAALLALYVKRNCPEVSQGLGLAAALVIALAVLEYAAEAVGFIKAFAEKHDSLYSFAQLTLKIAAVSGICEFSALAIKDMGENALAGEVVLAGKLIICVMMIPVISEYIEKVLLLLG